MHNYFSHYSSLFRWTGLALLGLCFVLPPVRAEVSPQPINTPTALVGTSQSSTGGQDSIWIDIGSPVLGIVPGQTLRISALNPLAPAPAGADGRRYKVLFAVFIIDADGRVIAGSDVITLDPGDSHSLDFNRADLPLAGEPGTGRLQVRAQIRLRFFSLVDRTRLAPASLEIVDASGKTTVKVSGYVRDINGVAQ